MREAQPNENKFRARSVLVAAALSAAVAIGGVQLYRLVRDMIIVRREYLLMSASLEALGERNRELETYRAELETPEARERFAKERFNLKKMGEEVVVVPEDHTERNQDAAREDTRWGVIKKFFKSDSASR